jgi:hypothetical protein
VQDYAETLVREIAEVYAPDRIEIESPDFMGFSHGYHHEKDGLGLTPDVDFLLGLCFCAHCRAAAHAAAVPVDEAQARVAAILDAAFAAELPQAPFPDFATAGTAAFAAEPALAAFLRWRPTRVADLLARLRAVTPRATRLVLIDFDGSWAGGVDPALVAPHLDGLLYCAYFAPPERIPALLGPLRALLGPGKDLIAGFQLFHPNVRDAGDLAARVRAASAHADGFNFYNLGLVPPARLGWISGALAG